MFIYYRNCIFLGDDVRVFRGPGRESLGLSPKEERALPAVVVVMFFHFPKSLESCFHRLLLYIRIIPRL